MPTAETPNFAVRRLFVTILTVFILIVAIGVPVAVLGPVPQAAATVPAAQPTTTPAAKVVFPGFGHAAVGVVGMPGVLATSGSQAPRPIASITKVVTALVVLEKKPIEGRGDGPTLTFTERDVAYLSDVMAQDGSSEPVQAGWKMPERKAIETMLIPSANNYAESLAVWAYGSVPKYLAAARAFLKAHGLTHTTLVDTNGLNQGDRSTPTDLVALGKLALASPVIAAAVKQSVATEPNVGQIQNTNALLGTLGVNGIKTGTTDQAGACLLFSAQAAVGSRTVEIVGVILGAPTHPQLDATVPNLLTSVRNGLHDVPLTGKGQPLATYHTKWGGVAKAVAKTDADVLVWGRQTVQRTASVAPIRGGKKGQAVGTAVYRVGAQSVPVTLVLDRSVLAAPFWWRLTHPLR